jgi:hypothetical protein
MHMTKVGVASAIWATVVAAAVAASDAPFRVHLVDAAALFIASWFPAQWVEVPYDVERRLFPCAVFILLGCFVWDALSALAIGKRDFFMGAPLVYGGGFALVAGLLGIHGAVVSWINRRNRR